MIAKDGQAAESMDQSNYEAAVLDFLDKEMADVQLTMTENKQSEELDALVADLLHQVMTESDQPQASGEMMSSSEDMNDLLAEFMPQQETVSLPENGNAPQVPEPLWAESVSAGEDSTWQEAVESLVRESQPAQAPEFEASPAPLKAMFASQVAQKNRMPMIAAAIVCALAVIGIATYYFSGSSGKTPAPDTAQVVMPAAVEPEAAGQTANASAQPAAKSKAPRVVPPVAEKKSASTGSTTPAPAAAPQKPPVSQAVTPPAAPAVATFNPAPAREERAAETQVVQSQPPVMPRAVPERQAPPVVIDNPVPASAAPEKKPAQQPPIIPASADNASPEPQPPAPTSVPVAARSLVPAVAVSQVSPKYPEFAMRTRASATVVLELDVDKQGKVVKATPVSGPGMFHKEAINAAMQWRYKPASIGGANVSSQVKVTFNFNLKK